MTTKKDNLKYNIVYSSDRLLPHSIEVEETILGEMILESNQSQVCVIIKMIKPDYFYRESHQLICKAIKNLSENKVGIDTITLVNELKAMNVLDSIGGPYAITLLTNKIASTANIAYHYNILHQKYIQRELIRICNIYSSKSYDESEDPYALLDTLAADVKGLNKVTDVNRGSQMKNAVQKTFDDIFLFQEDKKASCLMTKLKKTDEILSIAPGITLISGAGGIGKTSFLTFLMHKLLHHNPDDVSIFWNAIDHDDHTVIVRKMLSQITGFTDRQMLSKGSKLKAEDFERIVAHKDRISKYDIYFQERIDTVKNIGRLFYNFCEKRRDKKLNICIIDNVMRLEENRNKDVRNQNAIDDLIANSIADMRSDTTNFNSLIIYLHHMNKESFSDYNLDSGYQPTIDHIKGSGRFTDIPEQVVLLNRPGNYQKLLLEYQDKRDILEHMFIVDVVKNSLGPTGTIHYLCEMKNSYFEEL
jgi:replicative DNA helicase